MDRGEIDFSAVGNMSKATVEEQGFLGCQTEEASDELGGRFRGQLWWTRVAAAGLKATPPVGEDPYMRLRSAFPLFFHGIPPYPSPLMLQKSQQSQGWDPSGSPSSHLSSFLTAKSCLPRNCRHFWTYVSSSSRISSVNSHRHQGGTHRYPRNCHRF